jgi:hypothetical protein
MHPEGKYVTRQMIIRKGKCFYDEMKLTSEHSLRPSCEI